MLIRQERCTDHRATEEDEARYAADAANYETACRPARPQVRPSAETPSS